MPTVPLTTLLSWVWVAHTIEIDNAVEAAGRDHVGRLFRISLPMWSNGLRFIPEDGIAIGDLRSTAGCDSNLPGLERWGWIAIGEPTGRRRVGYGTQRGLKADMLLRPTRAGAYSQRLFSHVIGVIEARWRERFGAETIAALRAQLGPHGAGMPWSPPEVHPSDGFFTHVHVTRVREETNDAERPLVALLGQTLTAMTTGWERNATVSLPLAANVLRVIGADAVPVRDLPARTGLSKEAIAMAVGYVQRHGLGRIEPGRSIRLTAKGAASLSAYRSTSARRDVPALRAALEALVRNADALRAALVPPAGCWRAERPYLAQTRRLIADPTGALPWHPMVLHRGGWPDGS